MACEYNSWRADGLIRPNLFKDFRKRAPTVRDITTQEVLIACHKIPRSVHDRSIL